MQIVWEAEVPEEHITGWDGYGGYYYTQCWPILRKHNQTYYGSKKLKRRNMVKQASFFGKMFRGEEDVYETYVIEEQTEKIGCSEEAITWLSNKRDITPEMAAQIVDGKK